MASNLRPNDSKNVRIKRSLIDKIPIAHLLQGKSDLVYDPEEKVWLKSMTKYDT